MFKYLKDKFYKPKILGGDTVSEEKKREILGSIHEALSEIPEQYQAEVAKAVTHDIGVMGKTIRIVKASQPG